MGQVRKRAGLLLCLGVVLAGLSGCGSYWQHRGEDFADTFDLGVTYSEKWQFVFYHSVESTVVLGYAGDFEATFYGWGNGRIGAMPHYLDAWGLMAWADERVGWDNYNKDDPDTLYLQTAGFIGMPAGLITGHSNPHYVPT